MTTVKELPDVADPDLEEPETCNCRRPICFLSGIVQPYCLNEPDPDRADGLCAYCRDDENLPHCHKRTCITRDGNNDEPI